MQRKTKRRLAAVALVAAVAAIGGNAFTNSVSGKAGDTVTAGYASAEVKGATANSIVYHYSPSKRYLQSIDLNLGDNYTSSTLVRIGFNEQAPISLCEIQGVPNGTTNFTCTMPPNLELATILTTQVTVIDNDPVTAPSPTPEV